MHSRIFNLTGLGLAISAALATVCDEGYSICSPPDAISATTPRIGSPDFQSLLTDIVKSSLPSSSATRSLQAKRGPASLCCNALLSCLTLAELAIPFCYDRLTTNYFLPDGSFGTVVGGAYTSAEGDTANLETGAYVLANGSRGNLYPAASSARPDTQTLPPTPSQLTDVGVGLAVPPSELGSGVTLTYTTTVPGRTQPGTTIPASTVRATTQVTILLPARRGSHLVVVTELSLVTVESTVAGMTFAGRTVAGTVATVTTTGEGVASSKPTATGKNGAERMREGGGCWMVMVVVMVLSMVYSV
ncbi:uncharacterized protein L3040_001951 [Drepanopeziza brunnea f. sp. 'multigermtubi']|uniref:uncharacterized protein n=1 Tax=Drepanopeziza brunnea f. sp. 'multigermtubi' TaxID=698441 RepID=UPI00239F4119|nr:hypothetical protein L3040_001951 [Drepanopeziza brunnea f. sp. 'multigermtubi']